MRKLFPKSVPGGAEENVEEPKDPNPEEATASGGETRAEPSDNFSITREEQDLATLYENLQERQGQEQTLIQKKPPKNLLENIRARNARGLEQEHVYLGPGTMIHVRWPDAFKKENQSPWDTRWGYVRLTEEAQVSKPPEKSAWNWTHPTNPNISGHIKLEPLKAWEIIRGVGTKEQE